MPPQRWSNRLSTHGHAERQPAPTPLPYGSVNGCTASPCVVSRIPIS